MSVPSARAVGDVGLPSWVGLIGLEADVAALWRLCGWGVTKPRVVRIRQIVLTAGAVGCSRNRWLRMVSAPASAVDNGLQNSGATPGNGVMTELDPDSELELALTNAVRR
jgi:hypothetical protein